MKRAMPIAFALLFVLHVPATKAQSAPLRKDIPSIAKAASGGYRIDPHVGYGAVAVRSRRHDIGDDADAE